MNCTRNKKGDYSVLGVDYPSVTRIIGVIDKPTLNNWNTEIVLEYVRNHLSDFQVDIEKIMKDAKKAPQAKMQHYADIGTMVHTAIEGIINKNVGGKNIHWHDFVLPEIAALRNKREQTFDLEITLNQVRNCVFSFADWAEKNDFIPLKSEEFVYSKKRKFAGRLDCYGYVRDSRTFIDFKSGGLYEAVKMQLSAYKYAYCEMHDIDSFKDDSVAMAVKFPKESINNSLNAKELIVSDYKKDLNAFLAAKTIYEWMK
jgi:hypothetical protein